MAEPRATACANETALSELCQARVRAMGGEVLKVHGSKMQMAGTPDLLICLAGRFCAVELKQPGAQPTPLQFKRLRSWAAAGALAGWVTTEAELVELLERAVVDDGGGPGRVAAGPRSRRSS